MTPSSKPTKRKKLPTISKLMKQADAVFSIWIRTRDNYQCVICGSKDIPQNGHLIKRGKHATRYDEMNCNCQCSKCNYKHNEYPEIYTAWFIQKYGGLELVRLKEKAWNFDQPYKLKREDLNKIIEKYK